MQKFRLKKLFSCSKIRECKGCTTFQVDKKLLNCTLQMGELYGM